MVTKPHLQKTMDVLTEGKSVSMHLSGFIVTIHVESFSQLCLSTIVFSGNQYIPPSVRNCINKIASSPATFLIIDEENFQIYLHSKHLSQKLTSETLDMVLENFLALAEKWQSRLDEYGQQDLLPVGSIW